jgi:pilus assembly protein Flp/PilA
MAAEVPCAGKEKVPMQKLSVMIYMNLQQVNEALRDECGQDMVEYALVMGLIALGATTSMKSLATIIGTAFTNVGTTLSTYTS